MTVSVIVDWAVCTYDLRMTIYVPTDMTMTYDKTSYDIRIPWRMTLRMAWYGQKDWGTYAMVAYAQNRMP